MSWREHNQAAGLAMAFTLVEPAQARWHADDAPHLPADFPIDKDTTMNATIDKIAWIHLDHGRILSTRSRGKDVYYIPGGKREPGETDLDTLTREISEELAITIIPATATHLGTFHAQAHGHANGVTVQMTCYTADHHGTPTPSSEIEEVVWLTYTDRARVSPVDQLIFDHLHRTGQLH